MRKRKPFFFLLVALFYISVLQGCKGDDGLHTVSGIPFMVRTEADVDMKLLKSVNFFLNAENITTLPEATEGACGIGTFNIDFGRYVDSKYYNAQASSWTWIPVENVIIKDIFTPIDTTVVDTIVLMKGSNVIDRTLFLVGNRRTFSGEEHRGKLIYYDTLQPPKERNTFRFDLNVLQSGEAAVDSSTQIEPMYMVFDLNDFFKKYHPPELADTLHIEINYFSGWVPDKLSSTGYKGKLATIKITQPVILW